MSLSGEEGRGFTLIELIIAIVILALVGLAAVAYLGPAFTRSSDATRYLQASHELERVMENITLAYSHSDPALASWRPTWKAAAVYSSGGTALPTQRNGHYYNVQTAGTSGSTEPAWPTGTGSTVNDGTVVWQEGGGAMTLAGFQGLVGAAGSCNNNSLGSYCVIDNGYVQFVSGVETPGGTAALKVTIRHPSYSGIRLTGLFY